MPRLEKALTGGGGGILLPVVVELLFQPNLLKVVPIEFLFFSKFSHSFNCRLTSLNSSSIFFLSSFASFFSFSLIIRTSLIAAFSLRHFSSVSASDSEMRALEGVLFRTEERRSRKFNSSKDRSNFDLSNASSCVWSGGKGVA